MRALIQRVKKAVVTVNGEETGRIGRGMLILLGVAGEDTLEECRWLADKVCQLRIFNDNEGRMNLSCSQVSGDLLVVSQFTLYGDCNKGRRPSFVRAAGSRKGEELYRCFVKHCRQAGFKVETGEFGAMMDVELVNDGPVTLMLER